MSDYTRQDLIEVQEKLERIKFHILNEMDVVYQTTLIDPLNDAINEVEFTISEWEFLDESEIR